MPEHSFPADTNSLAGRSVVVVGAGVIGLGAAANFMGTGERPDVLKPFSWPRPKRPVGN